MSSIDEITEADGQKRCFLCPLGHCKGDLDHLSCPSCGNPACEAHSYQFHDCRQWVCESCITVYELGMRAYRLCSNCYAET